MSNTVRHFASRTASLAPESVVSAIEPAYYRYQSWDANRRHSPSRLQVTKQTDAVDHVLLLVVDCLRPDVRPDVPLSFTTGIAPSTWTFPSVTSIHTGAYPHEHGAVAHTHPDSDEYALPEQTSAKPPLPYNFEAAGFDTLAVYAFMMPYLATKTWYQTHRVYQDAPAEEVVSTYRSWRNTRDRTFAYLHLGDLHEPLKPPKSHIESRNVDMSLPNLGKMAEYTDDYDGSENAHYFRENRLRLYHAALDYVEDQLRPFIERFQDDTLIVLCGDHGEAQWEHYELDRQITDSRPNYGVGHGGTPFDMVARVPIGTHSPKNNIHPKGGWPNLCDIPRTLCSSVLDSVPPAKQDWHESIPDDRIAICEGARYGVERKASYRGKQKVIRSQADDVTLTATIQSDEAKETFESIPDADVKVLLDSLPDQWEDFNIGADVGEMVQSQLKALGYK